MSGTETLLRQLARGLSTYRLYPGDVTQPAFRSAAERIQEAAGPALAAGPADAVVRAGRFHVDGHELSDEAADRLADACFSRRVEYLRLDNVPTVDELDALYDALSRDPDEVAAAGGVAALLDARGVASIVASAGAPDTDTAEDDDPDDADAALPALTLLPWDTADTLYDRLRAAQETLDEMISARSSFYRRAAGLVAGLDERQQGAFASLVLERIQTDAFAERYAGHLTDPEIADLLTRAARFRGVEPVEAAVAFVRISGRQQTLVAVVRDLVSGGPTDAGDAVIGRSASGLRDAFPADADDGRRLALRTLADYLRCDVASEQLERVVGAVTRQLRTEVGDGAAGRVNDLLAVLDDARSDVGSASYDLVVAPRRRALTPQVVARAMRATRVGSQDPADVLRPFGGAAIDALVAALARSERSDDRLIAALAMLARDRPATLARHLDHRTWHVVRDLAKALRTIGDPVIAPPLVELVRYDHPEVRREALHGLTSLPPTASATALAQAVPTMRTRGEQKEGLDALAGCNAAETPMLLRELAAGRGSHALPWLLRRRARRLARGLEGS